MKIEYIHEQIVATRDAGAAVLLVSLELGVLAYYLADIDLVVNYKDMWHSFPSVLSDICLL